MQQAMPAIFPPYIGSEHVHATRWLLGWPYILTNTGRLSPGMHCSRI